MASTQTKERATNSGIGDTPNSVPQRGASEDHIHSATAERAYELYRAGGGDDGHDLEDWLAAEAEIRGDARDER